MLLNRYFSDNSAREHLVFCLFLVVHKEAEPGSTTILDWWERKAPYMAGHI